MPGTVGRAACDDGPWLGQPPVPASGGCERSCIRNGNLRLRDKRTNARRGCMHATPDKTPTHDTVRTLRLASMKGPAHRKVRPGLRTHIHGRSGPRLYIPVDRSVTVRSVDNGRLPLLTLPPILEWDSGIATRSRAHSRTLALPRQTLSTTTSMSHGD